MTVHDFTGPPSAELAGALGAFERQFTYPLGPGRSFRIEHGTDYAAFYRAIGDARCFACIDDGRVVGVLAAAVRRLIMPDGSEQAVGYIGDVKVAPDCRGGWVLTRLFRAARDWGGGRVSAVFGVVMDGTAVVPSDYTGRVGFPAFAPVARLTVLRLPTSETREQSVGRSPPDGVACFHALSRGRYACPPGDTTERSLHAAEWLVLPGDSACGLLEDTRRAKRLVADDGIEMVSAHLSCFAWRTPRDGARLLETARARAAAYGYPALFTAVTRGEEEELLADAAGLGVIRAPATVFATGLPEGAAWNMNTAEI